jgi:hypothetical protein
MKAKKRTYKGMELIEFQILYPQSLTEEGLTIKEIFQRKRDFQELFISSPAKVFQNPKREEEVLQFYESNIYVVSFSDTQIWKIGENYWRETHSQNFHNKSKTRSVTINEFYPINLISSRKWAAKNLARVVETEGLTLGERVILKNIAIEQFEQALNMVANPEDDRVQTLGECLRTDLNECVLPPLRNHGFKIKKSHGRARNIELKRYPKTL